MRHSAPRTAKIRSIFWRAGSSAGSACPTVTRAPFAPRSGQRLLRGSACSVRPGAPDGAIPIDATEFARRLAKKRRPRGGPVAPESQHSSAVIKTARFEEKPCLPSSVRTPLKEPRSFRSWPNPGHSRVLNRMAGGGCRRRDGAALYLGRRRGDIDLLAGECRPCFSTAPPSALMRWPHPLLGSQLSVRLRRQDGAILIDATDCLAQRRPPRDGSLAGNSKGSHHENYCTIVVGVGMCTGAGNIRPRRVPKSAAQPDVARSGHVAGGRSGETKAREPLIVEALEALSQRWYSQITM